MLAPIVSELLRPHLGALLFAPADAVGRGGRQPGIVRNGSAIYFSSPIFTLYEKVAPLWCKRLFLNALEMLLPEPLVRHGGPSTLLVTLNEQAAHERQVLHLLHYIPERRGRTSTSSRM